MTTPGRTTFHCIDAHTCGNPVRLVLRGALPQDMAYGAWTSQVRLVQYSG
jgi:proline racemase